MTAAAHSWPWQRLEERNVGSHASLIELIRPQPGERMLDVATGSGGLAFLAARAGTDVTGIDIAEDGVARARERAQEEGVVVEFDVGDAQSLPYPDASFDGVLSAFGVMFAADHSRAARELARVCRPGGRLGLTLMPRDSRAAGMFTLLREYSCPGGDHPADFADRLDELLGDAFELEAQRREAPASEAAGADFDWDESARTFAPLREIVAQLPHERVAELRARLEAHMDRWRDRPASYVLVVGRRR